MAALVFPSSPVVGQRFPADPGTSAISQWSWDGVKWNTVPVSISLGSPNQAAYNDYQWPATDGVSGKQLTTDGAGNLTWSGEADLSIQALGVTPLFDGLSATYTLTELGTATFFTPIPSTNIVVFLGGVPQTPTISYSVSGNQITFTDIPAVGTTFYAISTITF